MVQPAAMTEPGPHVGDQRLGANLDSEPPKLLLGLVAEAGWVRWEQSGPAFQQQDGGIAWVDATEIAPQRVAAQLGHCARHLYSRGAAADDDKGEQRLAAHRVGLALRLLESQQHPFPDSDGVLEALESGSQPLPLVVAEVGVLGAGGDDQIVVGGVRSVGEHHPPPYRVDGLDYTQQHLGVWLTPQHRPDGSGDVAGVERRRRHLVQHGLKEVVVPAIHHGHPDRRALERPGGIQPGKATAEDQDVRRLSGPAFSPLTSHLSPLTSHSSTAPWSGAANGRTAPRPRSEAPRPRPHRRYTSASAGTSGPAAAGTVHGPTSAADETPTRSGEDPARASG